MRVGGGGGGRTAQQTKIYLKALRVKSPVPPAKWLSSKTFARGMEQKIGEVLFCSVSSWAVP